jgi:hypothetical protein
MRPVFHLDSGFPVRIMAGMLAGFAGVLGRHAGTVWCAGLGMAVRASDGMLITL